MTSKKVVIKGKDFQSVNLTDSLKDLADDEKREIIRFLIDQNEQKMRDQSSLWSVINKSKERQKEDAFTLFFDPSNELPTIRSKLDNGESINNLIQKVFWDGIAGIIRWQHQVKDGVQYDITLEISSRFDTPDKNYFLSSMLLNWFNQNTLSLANSQINVSMEDIFHFLWVAVFKSQLITAYEVGIYKTYQYFEDNSGRIRGSIDIARHIRLNAGMNNGKIATKYRENTPDNFVNHLIIHTYHELKRLYPEFVSSVIEADAHARSIIQSLTFQAPSYMIYDVRTVISKLRNPISHPYFISYEGLRRACIKILSYTGISIFDAENSSQDNTQNMLFYTPDLWEAYIEGQILSTLRSNAVTWQSQVNDKSLKQILNVRPDFVLYCNKGSEQEKRSILDAKYKPIWEKFCDEDSVYPQNLENDVRQCIIYKELFAAEYTGTVFPIQSGNSKLVQHATSIFDLPKKSFLALGVGIPSTNGADSFHSWNKELVNQAQQAASMLTKIADSTP